MKFSVWPLFSRPWDEVVSFARAVEAQGWHGLWYADHYMADHPADEPTDSPALECWEVLAGLAAATERLRLGTLVSPTTVHHPALLAKRAATLDRMSHGRFVLGLGAGWQVNEHRAYGIDLRSPKDRVDRFEEAIEIVSLLLTQQRTSFDGRHFTITDAPCEPKPVQSPLPILVGTAGRRMSRIAARFAHEWNVWGTPERVTALGQVIDAACTAEGRDPATLRRSAQALIMFDDGSDAMARMRDKADPERTIFGTSEQIAERIRAYQPLGIEEFIVPDFTLGATAQARIEGFSRFWTEVVPLAA